MSQFALPVIPATVPPLATLNVALFASVTMPEIVPPSMNVLHRSAEKITSSAMIELFEGLEAVNPIATAINLVIDNARYNHSANIGNYKVKIASLITDKFDIIGVSNPQSP